MARQYAPFLLLAGLLALPVGSSAQTQSTAKPVGLKPGKAITQSLQSGQTYDYFVPLKKGEALDVTVDQKGVDVVVTAFSPDGTKLGIFDSGTDDTYKEFVKVQAPTSGRYRLAVSSFDPKTTGGTFVMKLNGILTAFQYAQSQAEDDKRSDAAAAYLRAPHPDKTKDEQRDEMLKLHPSALMVMPSWPEIEAARWLEGTWSMTRKYFAMPDRPELTTPPATAVMRFNAENPTMLEMDWEGAGKFQPSIVYEPFSRQWVHISLSTGDIIVNWVVLKGTGWHNNQLVMEGETASMGVASHERRTWTKTNDRTLHIITEERKGDGTWLPLFESFYTKTTPTAITAK